MLGSSILETAIGLIFVYLIFSLIASAIAEYFSALLNRRNEHLKHILFNLFDNDDPRGRTFLNLFVSHPMVQALNSTTWEPTYRTAEARLEEAEAKVQVGRTRWNSASVAVQAATTAKEAADKAKAASTSAAEAVAKLKKALSDERVALAEAAKSDANLKKTPTAGAAGAAKAAADLEKAQAATRSRQQALDAVKTAIKNAQVAANDADQTARKADEAKAAASIAATVKEAAPNDADAPPAPPKGDPGAVATDPTTTQGAGTGEPNPVTVATEAPVVDPDAALTGDTLAARVKEIIAEADKAAAKAKEAATRARKAAAGADRVKNGLYADLIRSVDVPKYIPSGTFVDVVINVLTSDKTVDALSAEEDEDAQESSQGGAVVTPLWDRFGAALGIIRGIANRLTEPEKTTILERLGLIDQSLQQARTGVKAALTFVGQLESSTGALREAVASIPDQSLREALDREIESSLRPLHALSKDILMLQRAAEAIFRMAESSIKTALTACMAQAGEDIDAFKKRLGDWYNDVMDHASGWYKRNTQVILVGIALVLCSINNVDTVNLVQALSKRPELRASVVAAAEKITKEGIDAQKDKTADELRHSIEETRLPLWWSKDEFKKWWGEGPPPIHFDSKGWPSQVFGFLQKVLGLLISIKVLGLLISTMAVSMGAPFWFDLLNKLVNVRLVGKRPDTDAETPAAPPTPTAQPAGPRTTSS